MGQADAMIRTIYCNDLMNSYCENMKITLFLGVSTSVLLIDLS